MILRRYMIRQVAMTTTLVLGFLVVMLLGGRLIRYFGIAAEGGLDVGVLFDLIGYNLPYFLELILPLSFFIGLMLVFGRMYTDNEMAVLTAGGVSRGQISRLLAPLVLVLFLGQFFITLVAKPWGVERATNLWQEQSVVEIFDLIQPKKFISSGNYHLYVGEVGANREFLKDVIIIESKNTTNDLPKFDETKIPQAVISQQDTIIFAKSATQAPSADGVLVLDLHEGRRYAVDTNSQAYNQVGFGRYRISIATKSDKQARSLKIEGVPTSQILAILNEQNSPYAHFGKVASMAEFGYRLSLPFLMIIAIMLATPLSTVRPRQGRWLKLIPAIFIFVANVLILISLKESIAKGKISVWIYPVAVAVFVGFALYLNYHERLFAKLCLSKQNKIEVLS
ncbi:LPS export ABC transporter permease LptF [Moraxella oblonga]|uniref:LPS export ABC transporter permease LptF n=1 Tax=Moraxella oblonga TaxID=200413 RepID=UPI000833C8F9|nr:LPS export ABC transporter permease LptF [Moraxella oblonga]